MQTHPINTSSDSKTDRTDYLSHRTNATRGEKMGFYTREGIAQIYIEAVSREKNPPTNMLQRILMQHFNTKCNKSSR